MNKTIKLLLFLLFIAICLFVIQYADIEKRENNEKRYIKQIEHKEQDNVDELQGEKYNAGLLTRESDNANQNESPNTLNITQKQDVTNVTDLKGDEDCILYIDEIDFAKIVYTGTDRMEHLARYDLVTAANDMRYENGGNYIVCGHASRLYGHSLNRLKEVQKGNHIQIRTNKRVIRYIVDKVFFEEMDNTDAYCKQSDKDEVTIISCAKYISPNHYIIVHGIKEES